MGKNTYLRRKRPDPGETFLSLPLEEKTEIKDTILNCGLAIEFGKSYQPILYAAKKKAAAGKLFVVYTTLSAMPIKEFNKLIVLILNWRIA